MKYNILIAAFLFSGCSWSQTQQPDFEIKTISVGKGAGSVEVADLNQDHLPDIVTTNLDGNSVTLLLSDGKSGFSRRFFNAGNTPFGVAVGDVNGDGILDLAVINSPTISGGKTGEDGLTILSGDGAGNFSLYKGSPSKRRRGLHVLP